METYCHSPPHCPSKLLPCSLYFVVEENIPFQIKDMKQNEKEERKRYTSSAWRSCGLNATRWLVLHGSQHAGSSLIPRETICDSIIIPLQWITFKRSNVASIASHTFKISTRNISGDYGGDIVEVCGELAGTESGDINYIVVDGKNYSTSC